MKRASFLIALALAACSSEPSSDPVPVTTSPDMPSMRDVGNEPDEGNDMRVADLGAPDVTTIPDTGTTVDAGTDMPAVPDASPNSLFVGAGDPYMMGPLGVTTTSVPSAANGPPVDVTVYAPDAAGSYAVVVFQHGFSLLADYYSTMLTHLASHGFVVVAPQMYTPAFFGNPTAAEEAADAQTLYGWVQTSLAGQIAVDVAPTALGLAGHSRGAKVLWLALEAGFGGAVAAAGLDPVDGTGGPFGGEARVLAGGLTANLPSLIVGTELGADLVLGQACAPSGDNHQAWYTAAPAPSYWVFAEGYGHLDMLDAQTPGCGITCTACVDGPTDGALRTFSAGQLVAFFRWQLQGDPSAETFLTDTSAAPLAAQAMNK